MSDRVRICNILSGLLQWQTNVLFSVYRTWYLCHACFVSSVMIRNLFCCFFLARFSSGFVHALPSCVPMNFEEFVYVLLIRISTSWSQYNVICGKHF